jgi:hypothetical protein
VTAEAYKNARAMGLTNAQYVAAAANIQDLLVPMGFQRDKAADISTQLVNLSGALSEWTGGQRSAVEVSEILNKALLGEREELKGLGISISEADVKARLADKGLSKLTGTMAQQAEAAATLELILEKSTDAQTQFSNGAGSAVRQQAELAAKTQEIVEKISAGLLPVFGKLATAANYVADAIGFIIDPMGDVKEASSSLADQTQKTQLAFNAEIETITEGNFTQKERARLISEINSKYSEYLPNLISEKASIDQIREAQEKANKVFTQKIVFQAFQEKITEATKKAAEATNAAFESEKKRQELLRTQPAPDNANAQNALELGIDLQRAIREEALQTVKEAPKQAEAIRKIYDDLAAGLGTTLAELEKRFGNVESKTKTGGGGKTKEPLAQEAQAEQEALFALQIKRGEEIAKTLDDLILRESEKRRESFQIEQEYMLDSYQATKDAQALIDLNYEQEKAAAQEEIRLFLQSDKEAEIETLQNHYATLLLLAEQYGIDTAALKKKQAEDLAAIEKKYADDELKKQYDANQARLAALGQMFTEFGNLVSGTFDLLAGEGEKSAAFQKVATLAKIAFDTAAAISSLIAASEANPANTVTFGAAGIAQYVAGLARILDNVAQAKKILTGAPKVQQKAEGRYLTVTGADDGRGYRARTITTPTTGLLPNYPVLFTSNATGQPVLASERGSEYFVSSDSLRNPVVANLTRMIDNITLSGGRVRQFADGGTNPPVGASSAAPAPPTGIDMAVIGELASAVKTLNSLLARGIIAVVPDGTIIDINDRFRKINLQSGGYFG